MTTPPANKVKVFIGFSREDEEYLLRLQAHLGPLEQRNLIEVWSYKDLIPGSDWKVKITKAITSAEIAILLVSIDFLSGPDFLRDWPLLKRRAEQGTRILPVIVNYTSFADSELGPFEPANDPDKPISSLTHSQKGRTWAQIRLHLRMRPEFVCYKPAADTNLHSQIPPNRSLLYLQNQKV